MVVGGATAVTTAASMRPGRTLCCCCETHNAQRSARSPDPQARGSRNRSGRTLTGADQHNAPFARGSLSCYGRRCSCCETQRAQPPDPKHGGRYRMAMLSIRAICCEDARSSFTISEDLNRCGQTELCRSQVRSPLEYSTLTLCARAGGCGQSDDEGIDLNLLNF
jgi:hypothetical protein